MSEQQAILLQIRALVEQLPPPLRRRYMPKTYHRHIGIYDNIMDTLRRPGVTLSIKALTDIISQNYGLDISPGVIKYHIDKGLRINDVYRAESNQYAATITLQVRLASNQPDEIYREYKDRADKRFFQRLDRFGQIQWVTAGANNMWELVPNRVRFAILP